MIAVDTNILVYAHREDSPWHEAAPALPASAHRVEIGLHSPSVRATVTAWLT